MKRKRVRECGSSLTEFALFLGGLMLSTAYILTNQSVGYLFSGDLENRSLAMTSVSATAIQSEAFEMNDEGELSLRVLDDSNSFPPPCGSVWANELKKLQDLAREAGHPDANNRCFAILQYDRDGPGIGDWDRTEWAPSFCTGCTTAAIPSACRNSADDFNGSNGGYHTQNFYLCTWTSSVQDPDERLIPISYGGDFWS